MKKATETKKTQATSVSTQPTRKTMDIHPLGTAPAVQGARPVIVTNKTLANDPMLHESTGVERPLVVDKAETTGSLSHRGTKTIDPIETDTKTATAEESTPESDQNTEQSEGIGLIEAEETKTTQDKIEAPVLPIETADTPTIESDEPATPGQIAAEAAEADAEALETATQEKTAEQQRADQLQSYIQKKTYNVPIDKTGRRKHTLMLALLVTLVLGVATLNILLDMGIVTIQGAPYSDVLNPKNN